MKVLGLLLMISLFISSAQAEVLGAVGTNVNYALTANGRTYERSQPIAVRGGYRFHFADVFAEGSYVNSSTGTGMVTVGLENYEFLGWVKKSYRTGWIAEPFAALGAGGHYQVVLTRFAGESSRDPGVLELTGAAAAGAQFLISRNVELSLEARATTAASYAPNPMFGFGGFLGIVF